MYDNAVYNMKDNTYPKQEMLQTFLLVWRENFLADVSNPPLMAVVS